MRFASLHLRAYGPFTSTVLGFEQEPAGLQVIFGPNEAGKSSALRALIALLFGIPPQTADNFRHDYGDMRVGAVIVGSNGQRYPIMRRKGNKNVLFAFDEVTGAEVTERPLAPDAVSSLLGGVDEDLFTTLFGLNHERLHAGGESLVEGKGDLGQALFQAGSGLGDVRTMLKRMDDALRALFLPGGKNATINMSLREYEAAAQAYRGALVRPRAWQELQDRVDDAQTTLGRMRSEESRLRAEEARLVRLSDLRPLALERQSLAATLVELAHVPLLAPDAAIRRATAQQEVDTSDKSFREAEVRVHGHEDEQKSLPISRLHLDLKAEIEALHHDIDRARSDGKASVTLEATLQEQTRRLREALTRLAPEIKPDETTRLIPNKATASQLRTVCAQLRELVGNCAAQEAALEGAQTEQAQAKSNLDAIAAPKDLTVLAAAVSAAQRRGDLEQAAALAAAKLRSTQPQLERLCASLHHGDPAQLAALPVPPPAQIDLQAKELENIERQRRDLDSDAAKLTEDIAQRRLEVRGLQAAGAVVTAETVSAARGRRDHMWRAIRSAHIEKTRDPKEIEQELKLPRHLPEIYEDEVRGADETADLLRADTERATEYAMLEQRIADMSASFGQLAERRRELDQRAAQANSAWQATLAPLALPQMAPAAFRQWADARTRALERLQQRDNDAAEMAAADDAVKRARNSVLAAYVSAGEAVPEAASLTALLEHARTKVEASLAASKAIAELERDRNRAGADIRRAETAREKLDEQRGALLKAAAPAFVGLGLPDGADPDQIEARLEELVDLAAMMSEESKTRTELAAVQSGWTGFLRRANEAATKLGEVAPHDVDAPAYAARTFAALRASEAADARSRELRVAIRADQQTIKNATAARGGAAAVIAALCAAAGCSDSDALALAIESSERRRIAEADTVRLQERLRGYPSDQLDALLAAATTIDAGRLAAELKVIRAELADVEANVRIAQERLGERRAELARIDGGSVAIEAREEMEHLLASIRRGADDYARMRLARVLLDHAIRSYQDRAQGPLLQQGSEWFARITGGRYKRLLSDYDGDRQVVFAERIDGARLGMPALSDGTTDQLYLALRIAAIELRRLSADPMPLVLDDILLTFDDERAGNALRALAELGARHQVLFFTHHEHLLRIARDTLNPSQFATRTLSIV
ncbi:MAG: AAA family ATPase [Gemmatimonadaceae bacterium]